MDMRLLEKKYTVISTKPKTMKPVCTSDNNRLHGY